MREIEATLVNIELEVKCVKEIKSILPDMIHKIHQSCYMLKQLQNDIQG